MLVLVQRTTHPQSADVIAGVSGVALALRERETVGKGEGWEHIILPGERGKRRDKTSHCFADHCSNIRLATLLLQ